MTALAIVAALSALLVAILEHWRDRRHHREVERRMTALERQVHAAPPVAMIIPGSRDAEQVALPGSR